MKLKEGSPVEVLRRQDESCEAWFPAKIICASSHKYTVRFEHFLTAAGEHVVEKVCLEDLRPCPPPVKREKRWRIGDIVEVFDLHSWRIGKVAKVLPDSRFVIRLFGSIQLKEFHSSRVRVQQAWQHNKWVKIGKDNGYRQINSNNMHSGMVHKGSCTREVYQPDTFGKISSVRPAKRNIDSLFKATPDGPKRQKGTLGGCQLVTRTPMRQIDSISFPKMTLKEKFVHASARDYKIGSYELDLRRENTGMQAIQASSVPLRTIEENLECSVASCSGNFIPECTVHCCPKSCRATPDSSFGKAESSCPLEPGEKYCCAKDDLSEKVHRLELMAYESTVHALYASGPLSWEQESLLTNLRLCLHISNEEHLVQLRSLLSS